VGHSKFKDNRDKRDGKRFVLLPSVVLGSPGYRQAGHAARSLLIDIAMQYTGHNNGKLVACAKYVEPIGWNSNGTVQRALRELQACGLLLETRKGARPNKAAWFALTWYDLDPAQGLDIDAKLYRRGDYMRPELVAPIDGSSRTAKATEARKLAALNRRTERENAALTPRHGAMRLAVAPAVGARASICKPSDGAIRPTSTGAATPSSGAYLEIPSASSVERAKGNWNGLSRVAGQ
jgi:hypothetical protein